MEIEIKICIKECDVKTSVNITISVAPGSSPDLTLDTSGVPTSATVGQPFSGALKVSGGTPPYSFSVSAGSLPDGVSLMSDGSFSGTPTVAGDFTFTVEVADSQG